MEIDGFFDIETESWDKFVCGGYYDGADYTELWSETEFGEFISTKHGDLWAWNGGHYDAIWLANYLDAGSIQFDCGFAGGRIVKLVTNDRKLAIRDAAALIPMAQKKAAQMAGEELTKDVGLDCLCGSECGGYCRIRREMPHADRNTLSHYLRRDCETGYRILKALFGHAERENYVLGSTIGGSAWATAKLRIPGMGKAKWERTRDYRFARDGYFGGRVFVGRMDAEWGYQYDINSAYPAALSTVALPHGQYAMVESDDVLAVYDRRRPGIYQATVNVPMDMHIPPLPVRMPHDRVVYPVGEVKGTWALNELEYALSLGCELKSLKRAIVWSEASVIFDEYMSELFEVRARFGKKHAFGVWQKWFANSLTGKFAMRPERMEMHVHPKPQDIRVCNPFDPEIAALGCEIGKCSGACRSWMPIGRGDIWLESKFHLADCSHVQWAAYLTASNRIKWHQGAMLTGATDVYYGDTDSIKCANRNLDAAGGIELGQWLYEGSISPWYDMLDYQWVKHPGWECIAPKTYLLHGDGQLEAKGKGLPGIDVLTYQRFKAGEAITTDRGVYGIRTTARQSKFDSLFVRKSLTRKRHGGQKEYVADRRIGKNGVTYPITYAEQLRRERNE